MVLEVVGVACLSAYLQVLFADIRSIVVDFDRNRVDVGQVNEELLRQLRNKLLLANGVLDDAERQQIAKPDVRKWLEQLKNAIQDVEDLVDEIKTEALRCQLEADQLQFGFLNIFSSRFAVKDVEPRIKNFIELVEYIVEDMKCLGLKGVQTSIPFIQRSPNTLVIESDVYGRDAEKEAIFKFLSSDGGHKISVMPIVGMAGLGKTTLAQLVYNMIDGKADGKAEGIDGKAEVKEKAFGIKAWITVSDESKSDVLTLTKAIYDKVTTLQLDNRRMELFELQLKLREALQGEKFLFVLDDVWNVDNRTWKDLLTPFESAANGSKIIVTTRLQKIARELGTTGSETLHLAVLSEDDGWKLFSKYAFENVEPSSYAHLEAIGKKIVEKCKGNPLAVKSLACLMRSQRNHREWENVLVNEIWESDLGEDGILPALWLSYYHLPRHIKRCFAYCSIIPKDYPFSKEKLILLWMAENLLQPQKNMMLEEVGEKYFEDLTSRSFFLVDEDGNFTMHDLVNDLAKFVSGDSCFRSDDNCSGNLTRKTRHLSYLKLRKSDDIIKKFEDLSENNVLRTLLVNNNGRSEKAMEDIINYVQSGSMQYLRVLSACEIAFTSEGHMKFFKSIGGLKHLRYLDLSHMEIEEIPDTICKLYNLQTLLLRSCRHLARLPDSIGNLKRVRHLDLSDTPIEKIPETICNLHELRTLSLAGCRKLTQLPTDISKLTKLCKLDTDGTSLKEMPRNLSDLKNLQNLPQFVVGKSSGIKELGKLTSLHGRLAIRSLESVEEVEDVTKAKLKNKKYITDLSLEWNHGSSDVSHDKAREVLDRLQPHTNIEQLTVENYGGTRFPDWMRHHSLCCITKLFLKGCKNCDQLPPLGELPSLEYLEIDGFDMVERIGDEFYLNDSSSSSPPFKPLKTLVFKTMGEWKEWSSVDGAFPNLKELHLWDCGKLKGACLPDIYLPSLEDLRIGDNHHAVASLSRCQFPSLRFLHMWKCGGMKSFPQGRLPSTIQLIEIGGCHDLESLSEEGWPCSNLKSLHFGGCKKLFAHGNKWNLGMLTSLTSLVIEDVDMEGVDMEGVDSFLLEEEGQLPSILTSSFEYGNINIDMEGVDSFPEEEGQLPTTLTSLCLSKLRSLKSLNGTALRHLTSLQSLSIEECLQLQRLPEERLPASLSELRIWRCPLLSKRCGRGIGQDWDNIHHIPYIEIDGNRI